ncbi:hypothetical protein ACFOZ7_20625 [Natribaculum luteum]|uniref:Uncharacterized protein n=1 Tax=Natribaculum luteum TaxID=1586232 RepID=A0ABD5P5T8_9EURY|nr:hypothetical protein [Natribaculum luteum]
MTVGWLLSNRRSVADFDCLEAKTYDAFGTTVDRRSAAAVNPEPA